MRKEIGGQVRRTFGAGQRTGTADVWDTATNEIPPEVGESPECQWCPICRAARRMRDSGPGLGGQLSGAGDAVASAVTDAISALDSILTKAGGNSDPRGGTDPRGGSGTRGGSAPRPGPGAGPAAPGRDPSDSRPGGGMPAGVISGDSKPSASGSGDARPAADARPGADSRPGGAAADGAGTGDAHGSAAGDHGPGGWKPGDRLATAQTADPDPWAGATEADDGSPDGPRAGRPEGFGSAANPGQAGAQEGQAGAQEGQADGQGHEPDDRG